ncbi:hypothetical protein [Cellulomonas triticagri]|uniref:Circular bacteriocin, circularin A/uberolysin family n=1 Tax=Cellulomonas triticagri TaxID=2483352 RepID=A0A3M2JJM7_9CELL|nr:hypothetical protein [Cellulomonas triticagri]RMI13879.1 hypothetical protein EBM89_02600 [Cellulomonas triticagri]
MLETTSRSKTTTIAAAAVATLMGLTLGGVAMMWVTGTFALSTATAATLWNAFEVGGWAFSIALAAFSAGTSAAIYAAIRGFVATLGKAAARKAFIA